MAPTVTRDEAWLAPLAADGQRVALVHQGRALSYEQLETTCRETIAFLEAEGAEPGDRVAWLLACPLESAIYFHALMQGGYVQVPLDTRLALPEQLYRIRDAGVRWIITDAAEAMTRLGHECPEVTILAAGNVSKRSAPARARTLSPEPPSAGSLLVYTSGTTGQPKGALLAAAQLRASAEGSRARMPHSPEDRWLVCLPLCHIAGLSMLVRALRCRGSALLHRGFDPQRVSEALQRDNVTQLSLVATMLERLLAQSNAGERWDTLRLILLGGGTAPVTLIQNAWDRGLPVAPTYGLTEAASQVATRDPHDRQEPIDGRLRPLPDTDIRILDSRGQSVETGVAGEICVRGPAVMQGYWNPEPSPHQGLHQGWLHTGDIGRLDSEGGLQLVGRRTDLIVSGGENIYPAEVEAAINAHPCVAESVVLGVEDPEWGSRPVAWLVPAPKTQPIPEEELIEFLRKQLAGFKIPAAFHWVDAFPRTSLGKVARDQFRREAMPSEKP